MVDGYQKVYNIVKFDKLILYEDFFNFFKKIGIKHKSSIMVHSSLKSFGNILNGPHDIIDPLINILKKDGNLLISSNTGQQIDPFQWIGLNLDPKFRNKILKNHRPYDKHTTLPRNRSVMANTFMLYKGVKRTNHPLRSILAWGKDSSYITRSHSLNSPEGVNSPLHKFYLLKGKVLLLGVDLNSASIFHLAENLYDANYLAKSNVSILLNEKNEKNYRIISNISVNKKFSNFNKLERILLEKKILKKYTFNSNVVCLLDAHKAVNETVAILKKNPNFIKKK